LPRNKYPEETRKKIMEESLKLFLEKGFENTSVLDIIENLGGLTRGAFYHHFKSKEAVIEAVFNETDIGDNVVPDVKTMDLPNGLERVKLALTLALKANTATAEATAIVKLGMSLVNSPDFYAYRHEQNKAIVKEFAPMVEEGMADGSIRKGDANLITELMFLLINHWMLPAIYPCTPEQQLVKIKMIREISEGLGLPIIDDEGEALIASVIEAIKTE